MKKKLLLSMMLVTTCMVAKAEDNHLYIQPNTGVTHVWSIPSLQKMTFQDGNVVLTRKNGTTAYTPISSIKRMFITTPSAHHIDVAETVSPYTWQGDLLYINAPQGTSVRVYNVAGALVIQQSLESNTIDFQGFPKGLYMVNIGGKVFKTVKK